MDGRDHRRGDAAIEGGGLFRGIMEKLNRHNKIISTGYVNYTRAVRPLQSGGNRGIEKSVAAMLTDAAIRKSKPTNTAQKLRDGRGLIPT